MTNMHFKSYVQLNKDILDFSETKFEEEYSLFMEFVSKYEITKNSDLINEGILNFTKNIMDSAKKALGKIFEFGYSLAQVLKTDIKNVVLILKDKVIFKFFSIIKWSFSSLMAMLKKGFTIYGNMRKAIAEFIHEKSGIKTWGEPLLKELDEFLKKHPATKMIGGVALAYMLYLIWMNMTFTGDFVFDFNQEILFKALTGKVGFYEVFSGPGGIETLTLLVTGKLLNISFPWPNPYNYAFIISVIGTLLVMAHKNGWYNKILSGLGIKSPRDLTNMTADKDIAKNL